MFASLCTQQMVAWGFVDIPLLSGRVIDQANLLQPQQKQALEQKLTTLEQSKGSQVVVLTIPTTQPETIEQYSIRVAEQWKIGRQEIDDGIIILIAKNDRKMRIEVGYGLEGAIPDAEAFRIIQDYMKPAFQQGNFYQGISQAVDAVIAKINNEPLPKPTISSTSSSNEADGEFFIILLFILFIVQGFWVAIFGRLLGASLAAGLVAIVGIYTAFALPMIIFLCVFVFVFMYASNQGIYHGHRGGGGSGGGFGGGGGGFSGGGGGFSGGGGGFGGGGASGGW